MFANLKTKMKRSLSKHVLGKEEDIDLSFIDKALRILLYLNESESNRVRPPLTRLGAYVRALLSRNATTWLHAHCSFDS
jgi:hypothetical protein